MKWQLRAALRECLFIILLYAAIGALFSAAILAGSLFYTGLAAKGLRLYSLVPLGITLILGFTQAAWTLLKG